MMALPDEFTPALRNTYRDMWEAAALAAFAANADNEEDGPTIAAACFDQADAFIAELHKRVTDGGA